MRERSKRILGLAPRDARCAVAGAIKKDITLTSWPHVRTKVPPESRRCVGPLYFTIEQMGRFQQFVATTTMRGQ